MILDSGICTIWHAELISDKGNKPSYKYTRYARGWYKELDFSTTPKYQSEYAENTTISNKIRLLQNRNISVHDRVVLANVEDVTGYTLYDISRAYHGKDDDGEPITDLELEVVEA